MPPHESSLLLTQREWYRRKTAFMERTLGPEHNVVTHAIIAYAVGGPLDLYYYPDGSYGTAIATKELSETPNEGSSNRVYRSYELVMFTRQPFRLDDADDSTKPFGRAHRNITAILNRVARYSETDRLNTFDTFEFSEDMERVGGKCLIFDGLASYSNDMVQDFGLLAVIETFRSEMQSARESGGAKLVEKLKAHGIYPCSDLNREPVT